ncbi:MAG: hypothetical protein M3P93_14885 [Actinomycetota bacterium]|nr:hypothetical protein [Actinomycetota bacterium]
MSASSYTDPELREQIKQEVLAGDKGGRPGQWSARKAQLVARLYKERGGGYTTDKEHEPEAARHLDRWTEEDWQTADGSARARDGDVTHRYLPKEAWEHLTPEQAAETDAVKVAADTQFVPNTEAAKHAGHAAREPLPDYDRLPVAQVLAAVRERPQAAERVREYEQAHKARKGVLRALPG